MPEVRDKYDLGCLEQAPAFDDSYQLSENGIIIGALYPISGIRPRLAGIVSGDVRRGYFHEQGEVPIISIRGPEVCAELKHKGVGSRLLERIIDSRTLATISELIHPGDLEIGVEVVVYNKEAHRGTPPYEFFVHKHDFAPRGKEPGTAFSLFDKTINIQQYLKSIKKAG
jgi:hypothetical protein